MKNAGLPPDHNQVHSPKSLGGSVSWSLLKAAVAYRVMKRYFKVKRLGRVAYNEKLHHFAEDNFASAMMADQMADQILLLDPTFTDKRLREQMKD